MTHTDARELLAQVMYFDLKGSLPEQLLTLTDKMTMTKSLEARVPHLDHRVVQFMAQTPTSMRVRGFELQYLQRTYLLPNYVLERNKCGFGAPFGGRVRTDLASMMQDYLGADRLRRQGLFDADVTGRMHAEHMSRKEDRTDFLLAALSFQIWYDEYVGTH